VEWNPNEPGFFVELAYATRRGESIHAAHAILGCARAPKRESELEAVRAEILVIEVRPCEKFKGAWVAFEAPGVEPAFAAPDAKRKAIDYACGRFGGSAGEVHVYGKDNATIERSIVTDDRGQYP